LPNGVAITDSGIVYYATFETGGTGAYSLHRLDTSTGAVSDYQEFNEGGDIGDPYIKILLSSDNARLYFNIDGVLGALDTATDTVYENPTFSGGDNELALSSNGTWMTAEEYLMDTNLNVESGVALNEREIWDQEAVYGEKMSPDGNLLFAPLTNSIDVYDGRIGLFRTRVALPVALSANYDALVSDGKDNVLVAITGQNGNGIAVVDLSSLPEPLPLPYFSVASSDLTRMRQGKPAEIKRKFQAQAAKVGGKNAGHPRQRIPHRMNPLIIRPRVR
jgi:WD40 repeat protein